MKEKYFNTLLIGDAFVLAVITILGFARHGELGSAGWRILTTLLPLMGGWYVISPFLGVYNPNRVSEFSQLWRPILGMLLAAPLAATLRGLWLNRPIIPVFVLVLGATVAVAILLWRLTFWIIFARTNRSDG